MLVAQKKTVNTTHVSEFLAISSRFLVIIVAIRGVYKTIELPVILPTLIFFNKIMPFLVEDHKFLNYKA